MALPTGPAVVFLFTDIEGSTKSERSVGPVAWASIVGRHDELLRGAIERHGGVVVKTEGDAFFAAFARPEAAVAAAADAQRAVAAESWGGACEVRVRMGLHLGEGRLRTGRPSEPEDYVGIDVNYAARIAAAGNGGQIVLSQALVGALTGEPSAIEGLGDAELIDAGARTVKDFEEPAHLYRLAIPGAAADTRPLRTTDAPTNLPGEVTALVGRDKEIADLRGALMESRIVTLTGPGGSGKTRLALGLARDVRDRFPHGTWLVDLEAVRDPDLIEGTIAATLGVRESVDLAVADALRAYLRDRTTLLVLDNLEQLLPRGAEVVARIVRDAPDLRVLITSRELLRIAGERGHPVPPLDVEAGVTLFVDRARAHRADLVLDDDAFVAIRSIAERLGGLPLAIELAAARVRVLSPKMILERLGRSLDLGGGPRDLPARQRTLRGAIAWSHELLSPEEQRLFARLGVFAGGWTGEAAYAVADPDGALGIDVASALESLADKSFVRIEPGEIDESGNVAETRFGLHPLIREFAIEQLALLGEREAVETQFAAECLAIAEALEGLILGPTGESTIARLDREEHNLRAAIDWSITHREFDTGLRIAGSMWRWFQQRGRLREGRQVLGVLLAQETRGDVRAQIAALAAEGGLAYWMNDIAAAHRAYDERLALAESTGETMLRADAHYDLGFLAMIEQKGEVLRAHERIALDLYGLAGREDKVILARQALVLAVFLAGEYEAARDLEGQNLEAFQRTGSHFQIADSTTLLAAANWRLRDLDAAWTGVRDALRYWAGMDSSSGLARGLGMAAIMLIADGDAELGARAAGATYRLVREKGVMLAPVTVLHLPEPRDLAVDRLGEARATEFMAEGEAAPPEMIVEAVLAVTVLSARVDESSPSMLTP